MILHKLPRIIEAEAETTHLATVMRIDLVEFLKNFREFSRGNADASYR